MGTNYYVKQKMEFNPSNNMPSSYGTFEDSTPVRLKNGWVYEDTYYATVENLNDNHTRTIHIGKSSYGWKFLLCAYPELGLNTLDDWKEFLNKDSVKIFDEYGDEVQVEELLNTILERKIPEGALDGLVGRNPTVSYITATFPTYEITSQPEFS